MLSPTRKTKQPGVEVLRSINERAKAKIGKYAKEHRLSSYPVLNFYANDENGVSFKYEMPAVEGFETEVQPGLLVRLLHHEEGKTVMHCWATEPLKMPRHYHEETEWLYIVEGHMIDNESGEQFPMGHSAKFPKGVWHQPEFLVPTEYIWVFRPPLPLLGL